MSEERVNQMHEQLLTTGQIAKLVGCSPRTVAKWIDGGLLPGHRLPSTCTRRERRVSRAAFDQFCKHHELVIVAPHGDPTR
jgi:excisionase family DNA binding protein